MHLYDDEPQARLRSRLRSWLADAVPALPSRPPRGDARARRAYDLGWQHSLFEAGFAGIDWPVEVGGQGGTAAEQLIFLEETAAAGAPGIGVNLVGMMHAGPTLVAMASGQLRSRLVPPILRGEQVWCQGFSEPGAGSDLAALQTRAVRDGSGEDADYLITGQKVWSTNAHVADWCEMVVRTEHGSTGHAGLSWLAVPMDSPGIEVRPIRTIDGGADFCEVFLDEVRCPAAHRVGAEGDGWRVAMATLTQERLLAFTGDLIDATRLADQLAHRLAGDRRAEEEIGLVKAQLASAWALLRRNVSASAYGQAPRFSVSTFKLGFSRLANRLGALAAPVAVAGLGGPEPEWAAETLDKRLWFFATEIAGGTSQIQRDIIAERLLALPRSGR
ncbi:acyl-CoA dehydrogenase family protein [Pseudonocardia spinosispora]|uniref:acyl-CoA dehydrogenase family protein n=1 Tax=Pseudonocardia spinosispora TaxID=103441 RepID=UPI00048EB4C0|nr:acyl-CoA dehydrogenase family protein [Pseudonocardia spinosispora]